MMELEQALRQIARRRTDEIVVATMTANMIWPLYSNTDADLIFTAPMGGAPSVALGIALARPDARVWVINGDGSALMYLGSLVDIVEAMPPNLVYFLMDNREWGLVGHLALPAASKLDFVSLTRDIGWEHSHRAQSIEELDAVMEHVKDAKGPVFVDLRVTTSGFSRAGDLYTQRMALPKSGQSYGKSGIANVQAYLAGKR